MKIKHEYGLDISMQMINKYLKDMYYSWKKDSHCSRKWIARNVLMESKKYANIFYEALCNYSNDIIYSLDEVGFNYSLWSKKEGMYNCVLSRFINK